MPVAVGVMADSYNKPAGGGTLPVLTGLQLWLDATDTTTFTYSSGVVVSEWRNKSGATRTFTPQSGASTRDATINGVTAVRFNGTALQTPGFANAYTAAELFAVLRNVTEPGNGFLGYWGNNASGQHYPFNDGNIYEPWGTTSRHTLGNPVPDLTVGHIYNLRTAAGSYVATINAGALFSTATNTVGFSSAAYLLGNGGLGMNDCTIGELVMYDRVLSAPERTQVADYLKAKWGTP